MTDAADPRRRWAAPALEVIVALVVTAAFLLACLNIKVDPQQRIGQVSALASLQVRFALFVLPIIFALVVAAKLRGGAWFALTSRLSCAALAGLATALVAGGIIVALRGTPWCLNGRFGDMDVFAWWATGRTEPPPFYPPLFPKLLGWYMDLTDLPPFYALKHVQIVGTALFGPVAYLSWRLLLRPGWALAIGVLAVLPLIEPYKPAGNLALIALLPVLIRFFQAMRRSADRTPQQLAKSGIAYGAAFGILLLLYSGWFRWSAPGAIVAGLAMFPWRGPGRRRALIFVGATLVMFVVVTWSYWHGVASYAAEVASSSAPSAPLVKDDYFFFDVFVDPTTSRCGALTCRAWSRMWPPAGELGGVGLFSLIMFAGLGLAVALGRKRTAVITVGCVFAGTWLLRFWYAHLLWKTKLVAALHAHVDRAGLLPRDPRRLRGVLRDRTPRAESARRSAAPTRRCDRRRVRACARVRVRRIIDRRSLHAGVRRWSTGGSRAARVACARGGARQRSA